MRLLIVWPDWQSACEIRAAMEQAGWEADVRQSGLSLLPWNRTYDLLLLHMCLAGQDGLSAGNALACCCPLRPPRILFAAPAEWCAHRPHWADCCVDAGVEIVHLRSLLLQLAKKPAPKLASAHQKTVSSLIGFFLDDMAFQPRLKGRVYAAWLLERIVPASSDEALCLGDLYAECAKSHSTTPAAVERSLRVAIESVFTRGSLHSIERFFGATVDPERGKPTNRAFLMQAAQQIRYSFTASRSPNSSEMHHNPAAPTSV